MSEFSSKTHFDLQDFHFIEYETLDSTNEEAKRLWNNGQIQQPTIIIAQEQTAGKGTRGRHWVSPKGAGLYLSIVHPGFTPTQSQNSSSKDSSIASLPLTDRYTQAAALACVEALKETLGLSILIKPINDLYAICPQSEKPKKLGGILVEGIIQQNELKALITGIGINLKQVDRPIDPSESDPAREPISIEEITSTIQFTNIQQDELIESLYWHVSQLYSQQCS